MRLIDPRVAAVEIADLMAHKANMTAHTAGHHYTISDYIYITQEWFEKIPTIEAEPVRHGHWIDTGSGQECSVCHEIQYGYDNYRYYCPFCGAKMEEQE